MTVELPTIIFLFVLGLICVIVGYMVPFPANLQWLRILCLVIGWFCLGLAVLFVIIALLTGTLTGDPVAVGEPESCPPAP